METELKKKHVGYASVFFLKCIFVSKLIFSYFSRDLFYTTLKKYKCK